LSKLSSKLVFKTLSYQSIFYFIKNTEINKNPIWGSSIFLVPKMGLLATSLVPDFLKK